jgi:hypothetical protein
MGDLKIHTIEPAKLKPGVTPEELSRGPGAGTSGDSTAVIRGKALIFWDPENPDKKLDVIDTDQITPAHDCVSESLDELDKKWKEGAFRYLMPDFRVRVHAGETFLVAGDRFAIGSSREMSPAGLKAIAQEVGLQMVIVCGANMARQRSKTRRTEMSSRSILRRARYATRRRIGPICRYRSQPRKTRFAVRVVFSPSDALSSSSRPPTRRLSTGPIRRRSGG